MISILLFIAEKLPKCLNFGLICPGIIPCISFFKYGKILQHNSLKTNSDISILDELRDGNYGCQIVIYIILANIFLNHIFQWRALKKRNVYYLFYDINLPWTRAVLLIKNTLYTKGYMQKLNLWVSYMRFYRFVSFKNKVLLRLGL